MKILTLWQPWASLIVMGAKVYETRTWRTDHTGRLFIHAAKFGLRVKEQRRMESQIEWRRTLRMLGVGAIEDLPQGAVLGCVNLLKCDSVEDLPNLSPDERLWGDFRPGRWAWKCSRPTRFMPVQMKGAQGLWSPTGHDRARLQLAMRDAA